MNKNIRRKLLSMEDGIHGMDLRQCEKLWSELGGACRPKRRTGEIAFEHPCFPERILVGRKKSAPHILTTLLKKLLLASE